MGIFKPKNSGEKQSFNERIKSVYLDKEKRRKALAVLSGYALFATGAIIYNNATKEEPFEGRIAPPVEIESVTEEPEILHNSDTLTVEVPTATQDAPEFHPDHPASQESTQGDENYCEVVDVPLQSDLNLELALQGAQTEQALPTERFKDAREALKKVTTREQADSIVGSMLAEAGITARFGADMPGHFTEIKVEEGLDGVESYAAGMIRHIEGLTYLPKSIVQGSTVNFVNTVGWNVLVPGSDDVQGSAHYDSENGRINLAVMNGNYETIIHEFMHRAHAIACKDVSDTELEAEYNKALELLGETDHKTEYGRFDPDVFMRTGIPTEHARDTHFELFAELSTDLLLGGYIDNSDENVKDSPALRLQEMVVERLQKAYPDVDWPTVLQFAAVFKNFPRGEVSPQTIIENKISPLDKIWGDIADLASPKVTFQPAIELRQSNDESRYIYVYESEGYYELYYSRSGNNELDNLLGKAATNYMQRIADQNGGGIAWDRLELDEYGKVIGVRFQFRTS